MKFESGSKSVRRAIVLLSGGIDSAVALYWTIRKGYLAHALTFDYFQRSNKEIRAAKNIAGSANCEQTVFRLGFIKEVDDLKRIIRNKKLFEAPSAYIPARNVIFYGIAAYLAELSDCEVIVGGHNGDDAKLFRDSSPHFFDQFNKTVEIGLFTGSRTGRTILPLSGLTKTDVIRLGSEMNVPFELTWSCQTSRNHPCGKCRSCKVRASSFKEVGIIDPLLQV